MRGTRALTAEHAGRAPGEQRQARSAQSTEHRAQSAERRAPIDARYASGFNSARYFHFTARAPCASFSVGLMLDPSADASSFGACS